VKPPMSAADDSAFATLLGDLSRNGHRVRRLILLDYLSTAREPRAHLISRLCRANTISLSEAAELLEAPPFSPPPSPPAPEESMERSDQDAPASVSPAAVMDSLRWLFFSCPSAEHVKTYLDTIMLLSTLMLGFALGFLVSFETEALDAADLRWLQWCTNSTVRSLPRLGEWCDGLDVSQPLASLAFEGWFGRPSYVLGQRAIVTAYVLACSLGLAVVQYLFMLGFHMDECTAAERRSWWMLYQWPCHVAMGLFLVGTVLFVYTNSVVVRIIFVADVELLLGGASSGLWDFVQTAGWVTFGIVVGQAALNLGLWFVWRKRPCRHCTRAADIVRIGRRANGRAAAAAASSADTIADTASPAPITATRSDSTASAL